MDIKKKILEIGKKAKEASYDLALLDAAQKNEALGKAAENIKKKTKEIIAANKIDLINAKQKKLQPALIDRLLLDSDRINSIVEGILEIIKLDDPVKKILSEWERPNGLLIQKVSVPLGVIGVIYESRPNVAADAAALCLKSSNATILRGGSESMKVVQ